MNSRTGKIFPSSSGMTSFATPFLATALGLSALNKHTQAGVKLYDKKSYKYKNMIRGGY
jgi:hypothetical protein